VSSTGFLRLPYSRDDSAWGSVMIPICVIRNGKGPAALLTGGNHGDEYEGRWRSMSLPAPSTRRTSPAPSSSCRR
jgi:predicted deacylase